MNFVNFTRVIVIVIVAALTGACATGASKTLAINSAPNVGLISATHKCAEMPNEQQRNACLAGLKITAEVAIENGRSAAKAEQMQIPLCQYPSDSFWGRVCR